EWVHVQLHQQKGMISLSPPTICNSAEKSDFMFVLYRTVMPLFSSKPLTRALSMILPVYSSPLMPGIPA
ncbi:hypothetical protein NP219_20605, partial [Salmonella enterica]|nr:hypothetical protein [Salmonella enterica]MCQ7836927.1 hypothetical protein [Salmonella enterica]